MADTSETTEQQARQVMTDAITAYARVTGYLDDGHVLTSYVVATAAESLEDGTETGVITSHPMPRWTIHGLLSYVDKRMMSGDFYTDEDDDGDV